jgi:hypothetical protein
MNSDDYLIIKTPKTPFDSPAESPFEGLNYRLAPGSKIIVRYLYHGVVFGFQSTLIDAISVPRKLLFLDYPSSIEQHNLRSSERIECLLPAEIKCDGSEVEGIITDISEKGCGFAFKISNGDVPSLKVEDTIILTCLFPGIGEKKDISGIVRRVKSDNQETALGIQFQDLETDTKSIISDYISKVQ